MRTEGVYVVPITYAGEPLFQIERVGGDGHVLKFAITPDEAQDLKRQLEAMGVE